MQLLHVAAHDEEACIALTSSEAGTEAARMETMVYSISATRTQAANGRRQEARTVCRAHVGGMCKRSPTVCSSARAQLAAMEMYAHACNEGTGVARAKRADVGRVYHACKSHGRSHARAGEGRGGEGRQSRQERVGTPRTSTFDVLRYCVGDQKRAEILFCSDNTCREVPLQWWSQNNHTNKDGRNVIGEALMRHRAELERLAN